MEFITNAISSLTSNLSNFFSMCRSFFQSIIDFLGNIGSIFSTLWFGLKSLLSGVWTLILDVLNGGLFDYLFSGFNSIVTFIGYSGALFVSSFLFVCMFRIVIAFVFKIFRLNVDYKTVTKIHDTKDRVIK